jgi:hypothetical protein
MLEFTPSTFLLSLIPGIVSTGLSFACTYKCTQYLHCIQHFTNFSHILPPPIDTTPWNQTYSAFLFSGFEKKMTFLFKMAIQTISL